MYLGEISYSIYMVHTLWDLVFANGAAAVFHIDAKHMPLGLWLVLISGVVPLAAVSYHLIERPARERLREWVPAGSNRGLKITPV